MKEKKIRVTDFTSTLVKLFLFLAVMAAIGRMIEVLYAV